MNPFARLNVILAGLLVLGTIPSWAQPSSNRFPDDPETAWAALEKGRGTLGRPDDWDSRKPDVDEVARFRKQILESAALLAERAQDFIKRFPTNENVGDVRLDFINALRRATAAGDPHAEKRIAAFVADVMADKSIDEDARADVLLYSGDTALMKRVGMRSFTEGMSGFREESETAFVESLRKALIHFPANVMLHTTLLAVADRSKDERKKELATHVLSSPGAPAEAKTSARHILQGTRPYQIGEPLEIRFTALDGRDVDLAKLKGKVVLIDFWATDCGPCVAEMPEIKGAYEQLHARGLEIIGISLDYKESVLRRFVAEKSLPWPQHFDGKGWQNRFAVQFGIFSIPTLWLVDRRGNLRYTREGSSFKQRIEMLLAEEGPAK